MAHRTTGAAFFAGPSFWLKPSRIAPLREAEKQQSIPARAGHLARDGAQRPVTARVELKAICKHLHDNLTVAQSACKECARGRQSPVSLRLGASNHTYRIRGNLTGQQFLRRPGAEVGISDDLGGAAARSEEHTSELQSLAYLVCRLLLEKKKPRDSTPTAKLSNLVPRYSRISSSAAASTCFTLSYGPSTSSASASSAATPDMPASWPGVA